MRAIWTIAKNAYREIIRDRILYGIVVFALLLIGFSLALGELSFTEQARISADFGFAGIQLSAGVLAIFVGSTLVSREIEKQTILTLLARPVSRGQFVLGKFLGLSLVIATVMACLAAVLALVVAQLGLELNASFAIAVVGAGLEALVLLAITLFFGSFTRPALAVTFATALFLIGHWVGSLEYFVKKSELPAFKALARAVAGAVPDLEAFNWRSAPIYGIVVPASEAARACGYAAAWTVLLLAATIAIFNRRDFV
jgi:ABC-type transport system involved in multi-copper enzyme maturation permease subunit